MFSRVFFLKEKPAEVNKASIFCNLSHEQEFTSQVCKKANPAELLTRFRHNGTNPEKQDRVALQCQRTETHRAVTSSKLGKVFELDKVKL
jgi:hypothetical protein